jgi:hypothetical protein
MGGRRGWLSTKQAVAISYISENHRNVSLKVTSNKFMSKMDRLETGTELQHVKR